MSEIDLICNKGKSKNCEQNKKSNGHLAMPLP